MTTIKTLSSTDVQEALTTLPGWRLESDGLIQDWKFSDFKEALAFVNRVSELAEAANHHPDIDIRYNQVRLALISHDAGGLTKRDLSMAKQINEDAHNRK
jgi:4a-hydroxytetrahydrobiopterin dehydratase